MGELDAWRTVAAQRRPQAEHHPAGLEEAHLIVRLVGSRPAEGLVERARSGQIGYSQGHQADPLLHLSEHRRAAAPVFSLGIAVCLKPHG